MYLRIHVNGITLYPLYLLEHPMSPYAAAAHFLSLHITLFHEYT